MKTIPDSYYPKNYNGRSSRSLFKFIYKMGFKPHTDEVVFTNHYRDYKLEVDESFDLFCRVKCNSLGATKVVRWYIYLRELDVELDLTSRYLLEENADKILQYIDNINERNFDHMMMSGFAPDAYADGFADNH